MPEPTMRERLAADFQQQYDAMKASGEVIEPSPMGIAPIEEQPTPPAAAAEPTPAKAAKVGEPKKEEPPIFGKYKDLGEAEKGYYNIVNQASRVADENAQLREQLSRGGSGQPAPNGNAPSVPGGSPGAESRVNPAARTPDWRNNGAVVKLANDMGLEPSAVGDFAQSLYEPIIEEARRAAQEQIAPLHAQAVADNYMREHHPEAFSFLKELEAYSKTADPVVQFTFKNLVDTGNFAGASEYLWLSCRQQLGVEAQTRLQAEAKGADAERQTARANAGLSPTSPGTPVHAIVPKPDEPNTERETALADAARGGDYGARQAYIRETIGGMLKRDPNFQRVLARHNQEAGLS